MNYVLVNACNGKSASQAGLNVSELKKELINLLPEKASEIKKANRAELQSICQSYLLNKKKVSNKLLPKKSLTGPFTVNEYVSEFVDYPDPIVYKAITIPQYTLSPISIKKSPSPSPSPSPLPKNNKYEIVFKTFTELGNTRRREMSPAEKFLKSFNESTLAVKYLEKNYKTSDIYTIIMTVDHVISGGAFFYLDIDKNKLSYAKGIFNVNENQLKFADDLINYTFDILFDQKKVNYIYLDVDGYFDDEWSNMSYMCALYKKIANDRGYSITFSEPTQNNVYILNKEDFIDHSCRDEYKYIIISLEQSSNTLKTIKHRQTPLWRSPEYCKNYNKTPLTCTYKNWRETDNYNQSIGRYDASFIDDSITINTDELIVCDLLNKYKPNKKWINDQKIYFNNLRKSVQGSFNIYSGDGYTPFNELTRNIDNISDKNLLTGLPSKKLFEFYGEVMAEILTDNDIIPGTVTMKKFKSFSAFLTEMYEHIQLKSLRKAYKYLIMVINETILNAPPINKDIYVFRGLTDIKYINENMIKSTSINPHIATKFLNGNVENGIFMITVQNNTPCLMISEWNPEEGEILLPLEAKIIDIKCTYPEPYQNYMCTGYEKKTRFCLAHTEMLPIISSNIMSKDTISVLTINIESYITCNNKKTCDQLNEAIANTGADVICTQEDYKEKLESAKLKSKNELAYTKIPGYSLVASCKAEYIDDGIMSNNIYVRNDLEVENFIDDIDITSRCTVPRCASSVTVKGVQITNLHACGGRYDDVDYNDLINTKENHIEEIIRTIGAKPDLIVGDFNSEAVMQNVLNSLKDYPLYNDPNTNKELFIKYFTGHYLSLSKHGYKTAYDSSEIGPTSRFGTTVDWMYYQPNKLIPIPTSIKRIDMMDKQNNQLIPIMTDHNAVLVTFAIL